MHSSTNISTKTINKAHGIVQRIGIATIGYQLLNQPSILINIFLHGPSLVYVEELVDQKSMLILTKALHDILTKGFPGS